jgi:hypothetical protein
MLSRTPDAAGLKHQCQLPVRSEAPMPTAGKV